MLNSEKSAGCAVTIGNFDGVHRGHQSMLFRLTQAAKVLNVPAVAIVFEPQPQEYFAKGAAPPRLMRLREKVRRLRSYGVDCVVCLRFNATLAAEEPVAFMQRVLLEKLHVRHVLVGEDFRFGRARSGDVDLLRGFARQAGFTLEIVTPVALLGQRISSTMIRHALQQDDLQLAESYLGRPYSITGRVIHGEKRGRQIGVPTANIPLYRGKLPLRGVYAVQVSGVTNHRLHPGVANIGYRPTVDGKRALLEVHLLDFQGTLYGDELQVHFQKKLRSEQRFSDFTALTRQIKQDIAAARAVLIP